MPASSLKLLLEWKKPTGLKPVDGLTGKIAHSNEPNDRALRRHCHYAYPSKTSRNSRIIGFRRSGVARGANVLFRATTRQGQGEGAGCPAKPSTGLAPRY